MVRERNVQRCLGGRDLIAMALLTAVALPLGARIASGDDRTAAPAGVAANPGADIAAAQSNVLAAAAAPREIEGDPVSLPAATDQQESFGSPSAQSQERVARLEAELAAARQNVQRLQKQLEIARGKLPRSAKRGREASLGQIIFKYQNTYSGGEVVAYNGPTGKLLWKLDVPMNAESGIRCYDDDTLLVRSADGYTRLLGAWDGHVIHVWAPGVEAPNIDDGHQVNPFGTSSAPAGPAAKPPPHTPTAAPPKAEDSEQRMQRMEESIRRLTDAVGRLGREEKK